MNIYRLQSQEELELLQSRIKAKSTSIKVHENELRTNTGTDPEKGVDYDARAKAYNPITGVASVKTRSRTHQERARASNKLKVASDKDYWAKTLQKQCEDSHLPAPILEWKFHPERKWRFDCAWPHVPMKINEPSVAVEIEGAIWTRGRHTRGKGFLQDMEKYNEATRLGWRVFRFTPNQVKMRVAVEYLKLVLS